MGRFGFTVSVSRIFVYLFVILLVCFTSLPLIYVISTAFKPLDELLRFPPVFFVRKPTMDNFRDLLFATSSGSVPFLRYIVNSIFISVVTVLLTILVSSIAAYSLVKLDLPFKKVIFNIIVATLMFPTTLATIPNYMVINRLGLMNSYLALILPKIAGAFGFFFVKQFCDQLPDAFLEAARLDGCNEFQIFFKIYVPLCKNIVYSVMILVFIDYWNMVEQPIVLLGSNEDLYPLSIFLSKINSGEVGIAFAVAVIYMIPTLLIFLYGEQYLVEGIANSGSVKG